jgi:hypothetical protein
VEAAGGALSHPSDLQKEARWYVWVAPATSCFWAGYYPRPLVISCNQQSAVMTVDVAPNQQSWPWM